MRPSQEEIVTIPMEFGNTQEAFGWLPGLNVRSNGAHDGGKVDGTSLAL